MVDPHYEILWQKVAEAFSLVRGTVGRVVEFEHNGYRVVVEHMQLEPGENYKSAIKVTVYDDATPAPPTLIMPSGR